MPEMLDDLEAAGLLLGLSLTLFLAISGSTILNMWYDHDIDAQMVRTHKRPAASGQLGRGEVFWVGAVISALGVGGVPRGRVTV